MWHALDSKRVKNEDKNKSKGAFNVYIDKGVGRWSKKWPFLSTFIVKIFYLRWGNLVVQNGPNFVYVDIEWPLIIFIVWS